MSLRTALAVCLLGCCSPVLIAQVTFDLAAMQRRYHTAIVHDATRDRIVVFGGRGGSLLGDTWEWNGSVWARQRPMTSPSARERHALAHDAVRGRVVLFGGSGQQGALGDTWEWDGSSWRNATPISGPPARFSHAMVYDSIRGRVVMFGGTTTNSPLGDMWEWDGSAWNNRPSPVSSPGPTGSPAMAFDAARREIVMFGAGRTWIWDGAVWTQRSPANSPSGAHGLVYDAARQRVVSPAANEVWEWDGVNWTRFAAATGPTIRSFFDSTYDAARRRTVLFGGYERLFYQGSPHEDHADLWEWDGAVWSQRAAPTVPAYGGPPVMAYDHARRRTVLFGYTLRGDAATWEWDGFTWRSFAPFSSPDSRSQPMMVHDAQLGETLLFGGRSNNSFALDDHWLWSGAAWRQQVPAIRPPGRWSGAFAYDEHRRRAVLFGGADSDRAPTLRDTWEWDGNVWRQAQPMQSPAARSGVAMTYDANRRRCVLFGGSDGTNDLVDTWEWDGANWLQRMPANQPAARHDHTLIYDEARRRVVLFGGTTATGDLADVWEWDGTDWQRRTPAQQPEARAGHAAAYHAAQAHMVVFGGRFYDTATWVYGPETAATYALFSSGCGGASGEPELASQTLPWIDDSLTLELGNLPSGSPAALSFGVSDSRWGGVRLPLDLSFAGMPGCSLLASPDVLLPGANQGGTARWTVALCNCPSWLGVRFFNQGFTIDRTANALGIIVSAGGAGTVGGR